MIKTSDRGLVDFTTDGAAAVFLLICGGGRGGERGGGARELYTRIKIIREAASLYSTYGCALVCVSH
jgi:hypothetical protein